MKQSLFTIALAFWLLQSSAAAPQPPTPQRAPSPAVIDQFIEREMAVQHVPGLALVITRGQDVVYQQGYGTAGPATPATAQTQFLIASVSKSFTALAVLQLVEQGRIALDVPVQRYLPTFTLADPAAAARITVRQLLNHTSGLADRGFPHMRLPQPATPAERVASLASARLVDAPGTTFHYFDPNYQVLARVVEVVSGQPFDDYTQAHIFAPLEMQHTFAALTSTEAQQRAEHLAQGHLVAFGAPLAVDELSGYIGGSGGVVTTAEDLAHFLIMQTNGGRYHERTLVSPASVALMHTPPSTIASTYGMGWVADTVDSVRVVEHNGIFSAFYADAVLLPDDGYGIAVLYDGNSLALAALGAPAIKRGLIALLRGAAPPSGGVSVSLYSGVIGLVTLVGVALALGSLLRGRRWKQWARGAPRWRMLAGIAWTFVPATLLLALPWLVAATSDRVFDAVSLTRAMPDIVAWLGLCALLGLLNGILRLRSQLDRRTR